MKYNGVLRTQVVNINLRSSSVVKSAEYAIWSSDKAMLIRSFKKGRRETDGHKE